MNICPVCQKQLTLHEDFEKEMSRDYVCNYNQDDHRYVHRIKNDKITIYKVRFTEPDGSKLLFKVSYEKEQTEIWTLPSDEYIDNETSIVNIDNAIEADFRDISKLKNKIKIYLLLS